MRSIFDETVRISDLTLGSILIIEGNKLHHLLNVVRVKVDEEILLLNGKGEKIYTKVEVIEKKFLTLLIKKFEIDNLEAHSIHLTALVGITKKETFEDIIRLAIEAGISNLFPLITDYSKPDFLINKRVQEIVKNSIEQSNNPWCITIENKKVLKELTPAFFEAFDAIFVFINLTDGSKKTHSVKSNSKVLMIIGAEGGFSETEIKELIAIPKVQIVSFPTPIMRTPTALAAAAGYVFAKVKESL